jgi:uncharacterized membrane protein
MEKNIQLDNEILASSETSATINPSDEAAEGYLIAQQVRSEFSGPLPHPEILAQYEEILPGAATRIFEMAEEQAHHRRAMEKNSLNLAGRDAMLGILFGFILASMGIIGGILIIILNPNSVGSLITGSALSGSSLLGVVRIFVIGSKDKESENQNNSDSSNE